MSLVDARMQRMHSEKMARFREASDKREDASRRQERILKDKNKQLEVNRRSSESLTREKMSNQVAIAEGQLSDKKEERNFKQTLFLQKEKIEARKKQMELIYNNKTSLELQSSKNRSAYSIQNSINSANEKMLESKNNSEQILTLINNEQAKELREIDSKIDRKHKYTDYKIEKKNRRLNSRVEKENKHLDSRLRMQEDHALFQQKRVLRGDELDNERFIALKGFENEQVQQVNQYNQEQYIQASQHNHEIQMEEEGRTTFMHNAIVSLQADIVRLQEEDRSYNFRSNVDDNSHMVRLQNEVLSHQAKEEIDTHNLYEREKHETEEIRERAEIEKGKMHTAFVNEASLRIIDMHLDIYKAQALAKIGISKSAKEIIIDDIVKENSADWDKDV